MRTKMISEDELVYEALNGSETHLNLLISMYEPFIVQSIGKKIHHPQDLQDLRQHVCCTIVEQITQKNYTHQNKFEHWTNRIIKSEVNTYFRKKRRHVVQYFSSSAMDEYSGDELTAAEETLTLTPNLARYLNQLAAEQAEVIRLRCYQDMTFREIATLLDVPINTVMGRYRYGIEKIRKLIAKSDLHQFVNHQS